MDEFDKAGNRAKLANSGTAQVGSGRLRQAGWLRLCSGQGANGSRSKPKNEIARRGFGVLILMKSTARNPDTLR
jgi:hypothetical protein